MKVRYECARCGYGVELNVDTPPRHPPTCGCRKGRGVTAMQPVAHSIHRPTEEDNQ